MRTNGKVAALSLALLFTACAKRPEPTATLSEDLTKDLAAASVATNQLAAAPQSYQRMRFVSDIERGNASVPSARPKVSKRHDHLTASGHGTSDPIVSMASHTPQAVNTPAETPIPEPAIVVAARPAPEPMVTQAGGPSEGVVDEGRSVGGLLGGILAGVVIRGGHAGPDKCDPRSDARARGTIGGRPDFSMPVPMGQPIFGGARRR
ncbi:MAG: hypothetical protein ABI664_08455 [bacterium]